MTNTFGPSAPTIDSLITTARSKYNALVSQSNGLASELQALSEKHRLSQADQERVDELRAQRAHLDTQMQPLARELDDLYTVKFQEDALTRAANERAFVRGDDGLWTDTRNGARANTPDELLAARAAADRASLGLGPGDTERAAAAVTEHDRRTNQRDGARGPVWVRSHDRLPAAVERGQRFADHDVVRSAMKARQAADQAVVGTHGSLGSLVRSLTTSGGSAVVPTTWAGQLIDRARAESAVLRAGAVLVPMDSKTVQIGRVTGDPTAAFRAEGSAIAESEPTFDNVTLEAKTMSTLVVGSLEWFADAQDADEAVEATIAAAIAHKLDQVALYGGIVSPDSSGIDLPVPPTGQNPRGVLAALNAVAASSVLGNGANGTAQTAASFWSELIDLLYTPQDYNETPTALLWNAKTARQYAKATDTTGQPLQIPPAIAEVPRYVTNKIPSYTRGTMASRANDVFAGDWTQLLIGQRLDLTIQVLTERYADTGEIGVVAHWRGDVGLARPRAFAAYRAIQGAA